MGAGGPTEDGTRIYANGTPVVVKEVSGSTNMYLAADTDFAVPVFEDISGYVIYGGWESGDHTGDTSLTILSGTFNKTVYGGSRDGSIAGDTNLSIHDGTFTNHAYGGSALAGANVSGCANVTVENATFINSTLWGAGFEANTVGSTNVVIKDGSFLWAYGGGNEGSVTGTAKLTITGGSFSEAVFGGSDNASASVQNTEVAVANANIFYLYGGGWGAPVTETAQINVEGGNLASLFGGGLWADVENVIVHIKGGTFHSEIFGGGLESDVTHDVSMTMEGGTFQSIFGSGNGTSGKGVVGGNVEMHLKAGTFLATIAPIGGIDSAKIDGNATIFVYPDALFGTYAELRTNDSFVTGRSAIKYAVDVQTNGGGTASASPAFAEKDEEVSLTASPNGGYAFKEWQVLACCLKTDGGTLTVNSGTLVLISETSNALFGDSIVISGGTITALAKNAEGDGHFAFNSAPTFGANYRHSVYAGDSAATAQLVASPTAAIYTASKYVRIEPVTSGAVPPPAAARPHRILPYRLLQHRKNSPTSR
ncbi:InlB B-repeat-containing protein [Desulfoscipio gibsoniae]